VKIIITAMAILTLGGCGIMNEEKNKDEFSTSEKADKYLISALEKKFKGRKFKVVSHDEPKYILNGKDQGTSLYALVKDQDGNVADAGITPKGQSSLQTDYMASYYISKVSKPIEKILSEFDFVENYVIKLDDWDEHDKYTDLNWTTKEFFENTGRRYQISVFLPSNQDKQTYLEEIFQVYNAIYDKQDVTFDLEFIPIDQLFHGIPEDYKTATYYGYYISHQINNHTSNFGKDTREMIEGDIKLGSQDVYNITSWSDYGIVWGHIPEKKTYTSSTSESVAHKKLRESQKFMDFKYLSFWLKQQGS
jgi:hypothetical protein